MPENFGIDCRSQNHISFLKLFSIREKRILLDSLYIETTLDFLQGKVTVCH